MPIDDKHDSLPEWVPASGGDEFACKVKAGIDEREDKSVSPFRPKKRKFPSVETLVKGIKDGGLAHLAQAITLVESNAPKHIELAQLVLQKIEEPKADTLRIGITGVPGAGKSTLIETFGLMLCEQGLRVAVLAIDPSSSVTKGSILGDKTRMEYLSRHPNAFIRPSPTGGCLGGVARKSRETIQLCESFGFDIILMETVGVGQSEVTVRSMVDFFLLVLISGAGDSLQGIKRGVMELADAIVINKADGDNELKARQARAELMRVLDYLQPATEGWKTPVECISAINNKGLAELWETIALFRANALASKQFEKRRKNQTQSWFLDLFEESLKSKILNKPENQEKLTQAGKKVSNGQLPVVQAVQELIAEIGE